MKPLLLVSAFATVAHADAPVTRPEAIEVDRDMTPPGQAEHGFDGGAPIGTWALGLELGFLERPLRFHTVSVKTYPVERRETAALGGAISLGDTVIADVRMPLSHQVGDRLQQLGDSQQLDRWVPGDLALGARLRLVERERVQVFVRGNLVLPTGDDHDFAGDARWNATWLGIVRVALPYDITASGTAGVRLRGAEVEVADTIVGDELVWGLGATVGIPPVLPLWCKPEQLRGIVEAVGVVGDRIAGKKGPSPVEGRIGAVGRIRPEYAIAVRIGTHLDDQIGAPTFRATIDLVYQPSPGAPVHREAPPREIEEDEP